MRVSRSLSSSRAAALPRPAGARLLALGGALLGLLAFGAARAGAQAPVVDPALKLSVTPYAGYLVAGSFLDGPIGTSLASANSPVYGAQLSVPLGRSIAVIGNLGYASGDLEVGLPLVGGISVGEVKTLMYDAGIELRSPSPLGAGASITPFLQGGVGAMRRDVSVSGLSTDGTSLAWNAGLGADLSFGPNFGLRLLAKDYIAKFDFEEALGFDAVEGNTAHNWALTAGLRLAF